VIICHCAVVSDRSVIKAVDSGARTLAQVCRATDAGQDCGACVFNVKRVITEYHTAQEIEWGQCASSPKRARVGQLV
jgi:bacterioferritin-associated ferredoxin